MRHMLEKQAHSTTDPPHSAVFIIILSFMLDPLEVLVRSSVLVSSDQSICFVQSNCQVLFKCAGIGTSFSGWMSPLFSAKKECSALTEASLKTFVLFFCF
ncbi:hypothetical protein GOODEAATRI_034362 [Goodea atripinnis]|uniref:Uncharacterized protein n=1 Tax=Goodea atripinnis TaxID=208336 RepID=A0ABV0P0D1_9TELE